MQHDRLGRDPVSVIQNREVSLIRRSGKYGRPFGTVDGHPYNRDVLNSEGRNREVPLYT